MVLSAIGSNYDYNYNCNGSNYIVTVFVVWCLFDTGLVVCSVVAQCSAVALLPSVGCTVLHAQTLRVPPRGTL